MKIQYYGDARPVLDIPDLTALQTRSYEDFLQADRGYAERQNVGLESIIREVFPIRAPNGAMELTYIGYELGLVHMGERSASLSGIGQATATLRVFEALLVGTLPLGQQLSVYGKAGVFHWDIDYDLPPGFIGSADDNDRDYAYGIGVKYRFSRNAALRIEWQRYNKVGDAAATGRFDVDTYGIGALISF